MPAVPASPGGQNSDPIAAIQSLLGATSGIIDPVARAALLAGAQAALAGLAGGLQSAGGAPGTSTGDRAPQVSGEASGAKADVVNLAEERKRRAVGA